MIYILGFFRRIQFKTAFYFSFVIGLLYALLFRTGALGFVYALLLCTSAILLIHHIVNYFDRKKTTHIKCMFCSYHDCILLYPERNKIQIEEKGSFACSSFDHGHYPDIYFCPVCKNGFLEAVMAENLEKTRKEGHQLYEDVIDHKYIENIDARYSTYTNITKMYKEHLEGKDVLEIGSYYGVFYEEARKMVKSYKGIEPSSHACDFLKKRHPEVDLINDNLEGTILKNSLPAESFDTIVMFDVLEHLPDPIQALKDSGYLLREGGHVIYSTINIEATFAVAMGSRWPWFMDMHYYYFSDRGYQDMLNRAGFERTAHDHFKYYVYISYFVEKVLSILHIKYELPEKLQKMLNIKIPIKLGDTVLITGKKEST